MNKLRPCGLLDYPEKKAFFHRWVDEATPYNALLKGEQSGQIWVVSALVELEDGSMIYV